MERENGSFTVVLTALFVDEDDTNVWFAAEKKLKFVVN